MHQFGEDGLHTRLTQSLNKEIDESDLVAGEVIRFPSYDGSGDSCHPLINPTKRRARTKVPALLQIHGGPGEAKAAWASAAGHNILVNHGYAVLAVNNRGSSGYGKTFQQSGQPAPWRR